MPSCFRNDAICFSVSACFILIDKENGFGLDTTTGYSIGLAFTAIVSVAFLFKNMRRIEESQTKNNH